MESGRVDGGCGDGSYGDSYVDCGMPLSCDGYSHVLMSAVVAEVSKYVCFFSLRKMLVYCVFYA